MEEVSTIGLDIAKTVFQAHGADAAGYHGRANLAAFEQAIERFPEVLECYVMMGTIDFLLRIVACDIEAYERFFFDKLSQVPGVQEINSMVALSEIKSTTALPLGLPG